MKVTIAVVMLCMLSEISCDDVDPCSEPRKTWKVVLIKSSDEAHNTINENFRNSLNSKGIVSVKENSDMEEVHDLKKMLRYYSDERFKREFCNYEYDACDEKRVIVIHLFAKNFYSENYKDILEFNFMYAGNGKTEIKKYRVNKCSNRNDLSIPRNYEFSTDNKTESENKNKEWLNENCETQDVVQYNAKLVSNNILEFPALLDFLRNFTGNKTNNKINLCKKPVNIIICGENNRFADNDSETSYELIFKDNCNYLETSSTTIALISAEPFIVSKKVKVATIFYGTNNLLSETHEMFYNPIFWPPISKIKFAIQAFMESNMWTRVAIISDDSSTSKGFEKELTDIFIEKDIIFTSLHDVLSDFVEVTRPLFMARPSLIIANIGEEYATEFLEHLRTTQLPPNLAWIFRGWSDKAAEQAAYENIGTVFSITTEKNIDWKGVESFVRTAIKKLYHKYKFYGDNVILKQLKSESGIIAEEIKQTMNNIDINATIKQYNFVPNFAHVDIISTITISPSNDTKQYFSKRAKHIKTDISDCIFTSQIYMKPCYDEEIIFITFVIAVTVLMAVVIVHFFQKSELTYSRMDH